MSDEAQNAVAPEPKVFVGQVPVDSTEEQLRELMQTHGEVQSVTIPRKSDSRRFAMVTFAKWAHAESAVDALQGTCSLGGQKPLVVRFADPPKGDDARGIFPKKLFVGQIPKELADTEVRGWFEPYGSIVSIVVKRNPKAANIAFVLYEKWAAAEEAMEALNGTMQTPGAANPLVVKFADGKAKTKPAANGSGVGMKRGSEAEASALSKRMNLGGAGAGPGSMRGGMGAMGPMRGMGAGYGGAGGGYGGAAGGYGGAAGGYGAAGGGYGGGGGGYGGGYRDAQAGMGMWGQQEDQMMGGMGGMGMGPGVYVPMQMGGGQGMYGEQMGGGMGGMGGGMGGMGGGMGGGGMGAMGGGGMGGMGGMRNDYGMHGGGGMGVMSGGMAPMGMGGGMMGGGSPGVGGGGMYGMGGGGAGGGAQAAPTAGGGDMRKCPWKLFVGQLPFSATEDEITAFFGQFGEVVECKVLRKSDGSGTSRGCGFVTFAHEEQAAVAMSTVNQRMALPGHSRMLIVHTAKS